MVRKKIVRPEVEDLKMQLARALADYDNLVKRTEADSENIGKIVQARVILQILPIFDMLINAQSHLKDQGLELVVQEFKSALSDLGVSEIKTAAGDEFNPQLHEAVDVKEGENGKIIEVVRSGYTLEDKVLRHAQVVVGRSANDK